MTNKKLDLTRFNPTVVELHKLADESKKVTVTNLHNSTEVATVGKTRRKLVATRTNIQKIGKEIRGDAVAFQRAVLAKEKELIGIIAPEEARLKKIEADVKDSLERQDRKKKLPERKTKLANIRAELSDEALLNMSDDEFNDYYVESLEQNIVKKEEVVDVPTERTTERTVIEEYRKELDYVGYNPATDTVVVQDKTIIVLRPIAQIKMKDWE